MKWETANPTKNIIVIPCLGEYPGILSTLNDIALADEAESSLVIVVVNNHKNASNDDNACLIPIGPGQLQGHRLGGRPEGRGESRVQR